MPLEIQNLRKNFSGRTVLDVGMLTLEDDRIYALIGANGSGKSTLLRLLAGTLAPSKGEVTFSENRKILYLPQKPYAFSFSVLKNAQLALTGEKSLCEQAAKEALCSLGMGDKLALRGDELSGGETARMCLARLLATDCSLLLLDEPAAAADVEGTDLIEQALLDYKEKTKCTVVVATHSPAATLRLADEVLFLHKGSLLEAGNADALLKSPKTKQAQSFLAHWRI